MGIAGGMALSAATRTWIGGTGAGTLLVRKGSGSVLLFR